jgi:hypothetical protein
MQPHDCSAGAAAAAVPAGCRCQATDGIGRRARRGGLLGRGGFGLGTVEIEPKTDEEWIAVRNSAYVVAEAGNLLMMNSRAKDGGDWMKLSEALVDVGQRAIRAAESKNKTAVFDVGAEVYDACVACHVKYAPPLMRPNAARPGS